MILPQKVALISLIQFNGLIKPKLHIDFVFDTINVQRENELSFWFNVSKNIFLRNSNMGLFFAE